MTPLAPGNEDSIARGCLCPPASPDHILAAFKDGVLHLAYELDEHCPMHRIGGGIPYAADWPLRSDAKERPGS